MKSMIYSTLGALAAAAAIACGPSSNDTLDSKVATSTSSAPATSTQAPATPTVKPATPVPQVQIPYCDNVIGSYSGLESFAGDVSNPLVNAPSSALELASFAGKPAGIYDSSDNLVSFADYRKLTSTEGLPFGSGYFLHPKTEAGLKISAATIKVNLYHSGDSLTEWAVLVDGKVSLFENARQGSQPSSLDAIVSFTSRPVGSSVEIQNVMRTRLGYVLVGPAENFPVTANCQ